MDKKRIQYLKFSSIILFFLIYFLLFLLLKIEPLFCQHVSVDPTYYNFGKINVGSTSLPLIVEIINFGDETAYFTINLQDNFNFSLNLEEGPNPCGSLEFSLDPGVLCTVSVSFTPQTINYFMSFLEVSFSQDGFRGESGTQLVGIGFPNISVSPESHNFGDFIVGNSSLPKIFTVSNTGNSPISITKIELSDTTNYSLNLNGGLHPCGTLPFELFPGESCTVSVTFYPQSSDVFNSKLIISSDAVGSPELKIPLSGSVGAQGSSWAKFYKDPMDKEIYSFQKTSDGGYIWAGKIHSTAGDDVWVLKLRNDGSIEWQKAFSNSNAYLADSAFYIIQTSDGGYIIAGSTKQTPPGYYGERDIWVIKLDSSGDVQWQKTYGGSGDEFAFSVQETTDEFVVAANKRDYVSSGCYSIMVLKLKKENGELNSLKEYKYDGVCTVGSSIQKTQEGFVIVGSGNTYYKGGAFILKIDNSGNKIFSKFYNVYSPIYNPSIHTLSDQSYVIIGAISSFECQWETDIAIIKLNSSGNVLWQNKIRGRKFGLPMDDYYFLAETSDSGIVLAGLYRPILSEKENIWVIKINNNGEILWQKYYPINIPFRYLKSSFIKQTEDGGFIIATKVIYTNEGVYLIKLDSHGNLSGCSDDLVKVTDEDLIPLNGEIEEKYLIITYPSINTGNPILYTYNTSLEEINICGGNNTITSVVNEITTYSTEAQILTFKATVTSTGGTVNEGTVTFTVKRNGSVIGFPVTSGIVSEGNAYANYTLPGGTTAGTYTIEAAYSGGTVFLPSTGTGELIISKANTNTSVDSNLNPSKYGQKITLIATVNPSTATGTVQFKIDGSDYGQPVELKNGSAIIEGISDLPVGEHTIQAFYSGDENYYESASIGISQKVEPLDQDEDGIPDEEDNCPSVYNPGQEDTDGDGIGDVCDNCPLHYNPLQEDLDGDKIGNACDRDADGDGFDSIYYGGSDCDDLDSNVYPGRGCPEIVGAAAPKSSTPSDRDGDGVPDTSDNCPNFYNPNQVIPTWYKDADNDDYSDGTTITQCNRPNGYKLINELIATTGDCDDNNPAINPKTVWFKDADNDGYGDAFASPIIQCSQPTGYKLVSQLIATNTDCNDNDPNINPGIAEILDDGKDNDCNPNTPDQVSLYNIVFEMEGYDTWLPTDGAQVTVTFKVKGPSGEEINTPISFILKSVTNHPGKYTNDSSDDGSPDFTWSSTGNQIHFTSHDFGGKITITATATIDGIEIHNDFTLPKDIDGDGIADAWEMEQFGTLANGASADPDQDGLSNFKEYRGFVWGRLVPYLGYCSLNNERTCTKVTDCGPTDGTCLPYQTPAYVPDRNPDGSVKVAHFRTNPNRKDLFVKYDNFDTDFPFAIGEAFATAGVDVHALDSGLIVSQRNIDVATITLEEKPYGLENGHINKRGIRDWDFDTLGYSGIGTSNQYGAASVYKPALANYFTDKPYKDLASSGQGNGMLDNISAVQDKNDNGLNDKVGKTYETGCSTCQWTTDVVVMANYIPQFGYQLSPMDVNNNGMVELPLVADSTKINREKEYTLLQVLKHVITHELGHAVGMTENSFGTCVMYQYTTDWSRDNYFSPFARDQMLIHNQSVTNP